MCSVSTDPRERASEVERKEQADRLFSEAYEELARVAKLHRRRWSGDLTLNTTAVVHEAYVRLVDRKIPEFDNCVHFRCVVAKAMRHLMVDYARRRLTLRRGGDMVRNSLTGLELPADGSITITRDTAGELVRLDEALSSLEKENATAARVVECRFFAGMTIAETAAAIQVSPATVKREWSKARTWLFRYLQDPE